VTRLLRRGSERSAGTRGVTTSASQCADLSFLRGKECSAEEGGGGGGGAGWRSADLRHPASAARLTYNVSPTKNVRVHGGQPGIIVRSHAGTRRGSTTSPMMGRGWVSRAPCFAIRSSIRSRYVPDTLARPSVRTDARNRSIAA